MNEIRLQNDSEPQVIEILHADDEVPSARRPPTRIPPPGIYRGMVPATRRPRFEDRRVAQRHRAKEGRCWIGWHDAGLFRQSAAWIIDISASGGLIATDAPPPGDRSVWIRLDNALVPDWAETRLVTLQSSQGGIYAARVVFRGTCPYSLLKEVAFSLANPDASRPGPSSFVEPQRMVSCDRAEAIFPSQRRPGGFQAPREVLCYRVSSADDLAPLGTAMGERDEGKASGPRRRDERRKGPRASRRPEAETGADLRRGRPEAGRWARFRARPPALRRRDGARLRGRDGAVARGGRRGRPRRLAFRAPGVRRQPLGPRRPGRIALEGVQRPVAGAGPLRLWLRAGPAPLPAGFDGRLPPQRLANRPFYDAIDGLATCYDALGKPDEAAGLRDLSRRLSGGDRPGGPPRPRGGEGSFGNGRRLPGGDSDFSGFFRLAMISRTG